MRYYNIGSQFSNGFNPQTGREVVRSNGSKLVSVDAKTSMVTVKRGAKKGSHAIRILVIAAGDQDHEGALWAEWVKSKVVNMLTNPLDAEGKQVSVTAGKSLSVKTIMSVKGAKGRVAYEIVSGNKRITVASSGRVKVKKGLKKVVYRIRVRVTASGNATYKNASKTVTCAIVVS